MQEIMVKLSRSVYSEAVSSPSDLVCCPAEGTCTEYCRASSAASRSSELKLFLAETIPIFPLAPVKGDYSQSAGSPLTLSSFTFLELSLQKLAKDPEHSRKFGPFIMFVLRVLSLFAG